MRGLEDPAGGQRQGDRLRPGGTMAAAQGLREGIAEIDLGTSTSRASSCGS